MKKIKITENELITLIEKIVNEQATGIAFGGGFENMGVSKPTDKYKDLNLEGDDIEDEVAEDEVAEEEVAEEEFNESEIVERLRKRMGTRKFPEKVITEQRNVTKWTREEIDNVTDMVSEIYNDMVQRRDAPQRNISTPRGPQG